VLLAVHWIFKNKDHGKTSATASLGLISLWDVEGGLPLIDKYLYSNDNAIVAGALLATGLVNCGVQNENDPGVWWSSGLQAESVLHGGAWGFLCLLVKGRYRLRANLFSCHIC
jgi:hypothetical protein